jgi:hypothetical protein
MPDVVHSIERGDRAGASEATPLLLDFLQWLALSPRPYLEVMDAWRTSCPRLTIWEDAVDERLVVRRRDDGNHSVVALTERGRRLLEDVAEAGVREA